MKRKVIIGCLGALLLIGTGIAIAVVRAARTPRYRDNPELKATLEGVYTRYLQSIQREDRQMLLSVLTSTRVQDLTRTFELHRMKFPDDYFTEFKNDSPKLPPPDALSYVAVTHGDRFANLIYVGNLKGYLRKKTDEQCFFIVQFEKENENWKYWVCVDLPSNIVPYLNDRLKDQRLYFLKFKPFKPDRIELIP